MLICKRLFVLLLCFWLAACAKPQTQRYEGENLVLPYAKELKSWQLFSKDENGVRASMWQKPGEKWVDTYAVTVQFNKTVDMQAQRELMDKPGKENCSKFSSTVLTHPYAGYFPTLYWETACQINGQPGARLIHLMIQGNTSFYHIQKVWKSGYQQEDLKTWRARFEKTFVCDTLSNQAPCPQEPNPDND